MTTETDIIHKPLAVEFKREGYAFKQILRKGDKAIYAQLKHGTPTKYEVVKIKRHDGFTVGGAFVPPAECYPPSSSWGVDGFTCESLARAKEKMGEL